jgi:hypothetical protein
VCVFVLLSQFCCIHILFTFESLNERFGQQSGGPGPSRAVAPDENNSFIVVVVFCIMKYV